MRCIPLAKEYTETLCRRIEQETLTVNNFKSSKHENIWVKVIKPSIHDVTGHPNRNYNHIINKVCGVSGLYTMYMGRDGHSNVAKYAFEVYCVRLNPSYFGLYANFVTLCLRLR